MLVVASCLLFGACVLFVDCCVMLLTRRGLLLFADMRCALSVAACY